MRKLIVNIFKKIGLYTFLLNQKRAFNIKREAKQEERNKLKRTIFYSKFLFPGDLVFDIGANVGNRVSNFLEIGCKVVAIEPQQECINELKNRFGSKIQIVEKGLGEKEETKTLYISDANTISSLSEEWIKSVKKSRFKNHEWNKSAQIELTTMDKLIAEYGIPKFCKIDVEGFELEVLKGLHTPIPCLSLEYTVPEQTNKLLACIQYCNELNNDYTYNYSIGEKMKFELDEFIRLDQFVKVIQEKGFQKSGFGDIYLRI